MQKMWKYFLVIVLRSGVLASNFGFSASYVPEEYYANYRIADEWSQLISLLEDIEASTRVGLDVTERQFSDLNRMFDVVLEYFPASPSNNVIYKQCDLATQALADEVNRNNYAIFKDRCFSQIGQIISDIERSFTVKPRISVNPKDGPAPLNVTLDARGSVDPSNDTIPSDNFFWYYKDVYGDEQQIGKGPVVNYTFDEPGNHIVHLTVRSSNNDTEGVFDGEASVAINVSPKAANMVLYVNGQQARPERLIKVGSQDALDGILIDGTATRPIGARTIAEHRREITSNQQYSFVENGEGEPGQFLHTFPDNGVYTITLQIIDNQGNRLRESYQVSVSDPVATFKMSPAKGTTSTSFTFDASPSYSITSRIQTYQWTVTDPGGNQIDVVQSKELKRKFPLPGTYTIKLVVTDEGGSSSYDTQQLFVNSTAPVPTYTVEPQSEVEYPSEFILDATSTFDEDVRNGTDELTFRWLFSNSEYVTIERSFNDDDSKIRIVVDQPGNYKVKLQVEDSYGEVTEIEKEIEVESTIRPDIMITPQVGSRGKTVTFLAKVNKPVSFYEWDFGDGDRQQSEVLKVSHVYQKAGTYKVVLRVRTLQGEENEIVKYVFMGQKDMPVPAYQIKSAGDVGLKQSSTCIDLEGNSVPAFVVERYENFLLNATSSTNAQGTTTDLNISFHPQNDEVYNKSTLNYNFLELGCRYVDLFVEDSNLGKTESTRIWFDVVNALPILKNLTLQFPQVPESSPVGVGLDAGILDGTNVFTDTTLSSVIVKVSAQGSRDPDGFISHYRWYYYPSDDPNRKEGFKITPSDVPYATFVIPKPPYATEYAFAVDMIDNDDGKSSSETIIGKGPIIFFPPGENSLDVPIVTLSTNAINARVGDEITFTTKSSVLSERPDFELTRYFRYDFDGDGQYDLPPTKKEVVSHVYTEPGQKRPKVAVFYRGRAGVGNTEPIVIRKGLKPRFLSTTYDKKVLIKDFSLGDISVARVCLDTSVCGDDEDQQMLIEQDAFLHEYDEYGTYTASMSVVDEFGNEESVEQQIIVEEQDAPVGILSLPEGRYLNDSTYEIPIGSNLENSLDIYLDHDANCYMDVDVSVDSNGDGEPTIDEDIPCNELVTYQFFPTQKEITGRLYYVENQKVEKIDVKFVFIDFEEVIPEEFERAHGQITDLLDMVDSSTDDDLLLFYKDLLTNLKNVLGEQDQMNSLTIQLRDLLAEHPGLISEDEKELLETLLLSLSDAVVAEIYGGTAYQTAKANVLVRFSEPYKTQVTEQFAAFERANGNKDEMKAVLDQVFTLAAEVRKSGQLDEVDFNYIKQRLCDIVVYYELPSKTCGTADEEVEISDDSNSGSSSETRSVASKILRIVLIVVIVLAVIFVGMIVVFAIKARKQKDEQDGDQ